VESPEEVVKVGQEIDVKVLRVDPGERKVSLSRKQASHPGVPEEEEEVVEGDASRAEKPRSKELKGGTGTGGGQLFQRPGQAEGDSPPEEAK
jgi:small subunit ribosomal protein S1